LKFTKKIRGFTLVEIMIAMFILAVAVLPILSIMFRGRDTTKFAEAHAHAAEIASKVMTALLEDVPFKCLMPGGVPYKDLVSEIKAKTLGDDDSPLDGIAGVNCGVGSGRNGTWPNCARGADGVDIIVDDPSTTSKDENKIYMNNIFNKDASDPKHKFSFKDKLGQRYWISVRVEVVPVAFRYFETNINSTQTGNNGGSSWKLSYLEDTTMPTMDRVFGDEPTASSNGPANLYLAGDVPDSRLKKITVTVIWREKIVSSGNPEMNMGPGGKIARKTPVRFYSLISFKAKLED